MHFVQISIQKQGNHLFCDNSGPVSGRFLHSITEGGVHIHMLLGKISSSYLAQYKKLCMGIFCDLFFCQLKNIMVISPGQPFVRRYHNISDLSVLRLYLRPFIEIFMLDIRYMTQDTSDSRLQCIKIRFCICQNLFGLLHLRRRDHVHSVGDLHRILNTFYTTLNFFCACHLITCSCS